MREESIFKPIILADLSSTDMIIKKIDKNEKIISTTSSNEEYNRVMSYYNSEGAKEYKKI